MYSKASQIKNHRLYPEFVKISQRLAAHQFVCWLAGGAVRDLLLDREISDFDLVTDASTDVLKVLFPEAVLVGEAFGVLKIPVFSGDTIDLATFREEADYKDGRRPSAVKSSTPVQDSLRRDFTVNSFFWDDQAKTVRDYQGGLLDLERRQLKCVGDPRVRFGEDFLRIVRLMRFSLQLNFSLDKETLKAAREGLANIDRVSGERIWAELKKLEAHQAWPTGEHKTSEVKDFEEALQFFKDVLAQIFKDLSFQKSSFSKISGWVSAETALYLLNPEKDCSEILKNRLKISNKELEHYRNIRFLATDAKKLTTEELIFEIERSEELDRDFRAVVSVGILPKNLSEKIEILRAEHPYRLVSGAEMKDLVPPRQISEEIRNIRVGQLGKKFRTKADAISYLKKKYA